MFTIPLNIQNVGALNNIIYLIIYLFIYLFIYFLFIYLFIFFFFFFFCITNNTTQRANEFVCQDSFFSSFFFFSHYKGSNLLRLLDTQHKNALPYKTDLFVLKSSQPQVVMSRAVSLPNHPFSRQT